MKQLRLEEYGRAADLFGGMAAWHVYVTAVLAGDSPGWVYVDSRDAPRSGCVVSLDGVYLVGAPDNQAFNAAFRVELANTLLADDRLNPAAPSLLVRMDAPGWEAALADLVADWRWPPLLSTQRHYRFVGGGDAGPANAPSDAIIARLDAALLQTHGDRLPQNLADTLRIGWQSEANFLAKGFGFAAVLGKEIVCWCLANVVSGGQCELSVETLPGQRRRGLATAVTAATVAFCQQQGFTHVGWHCGADNPGSIKTAVNAGFALDRTYTLYEFYYDEARHYAELGKLYFFADMVADAADALDLALTLAADAPSYVYLLAARAEAKLGNGRYALTLLATAVDAGFSDANLLRSLPEFAPLHAEADWAALLALLAN